MTAVLRRRNSLLAVRATMAFATVVLGLVFAGDAILQRSHPDVYRAACIAVSVGAGFMVVFWSTRWPTRWQSRVAAWSGTLLMASWGLAQSAAMTVALACVAVALMSGYLAVFHGLLDVVANTVVALTLSVRTAWLLIEHAGAVVAIAPVLILLLPTVTVPAALAGLARALRAYAVLADQDQLTGLLNRRAFSEEIIRIIGEVQRLPSASRLKLVVIMIDIDKFKRINDTLGHAEGDRVLLTVTSVLRRHVPLPAILCRAGGEEFLVGMVTRGEAVALAERIRDAVRTETHGVTVSIGIASKNLTGRHAVRSADLLDELIKCADAAMYDVKREGGDDTRLH